MPLMTRPSSSRSTPPDIPRQAWFNPFPLLIAQPKQVPAHDPNPLPKTNQDRIVRAEKLMSSDSSSLAGDCFSLPLIFIKANTPPTRIATHRTLSETRPVELNHGTAKRF